MLVGINFALGLTLVDVLTGFPLPFGAPDELEVAAGATDFPPALELPLACGRLPLFPHVRLEDPEDFEAFWNGLAESLANFVLI